MQEKIFKNTPLAIVHGGVEIVKSTLLYFMVIIIGSISGTDVMGVLIGCTAVLGYFVIALGFSAIKWFKSTITLNEQAIIIDVQTIFKKVTNIQLKNISAIDISQNILDKLLKTAKIQIDINSTATANENDAVIRLNYDEAFEVRDLILSYMSSGKEVPTGPLETNTYELTRSEDTVTQSKNKITLEDYDYSFDAIEILKHSVLSTNVLIALMIWPLLASIIPDFVWNSLNTRESIILGVGLTILSLVLASAKTFIRYYGFKLKKEEDRIVVSYGLFSTVRFNLPYDKINGLKISQSLFGRIFRLYKVEPISIGFTDGEQVSIILPYMSKVEVYKAIKDLFDIDMDIEMVSTDSNGLKAEFADNSLGLMTVSLIAGFFNMWVGVAVFATFIIVVLLRNDANKIAIINSRLYVCSGVIGRKIITCKIEKIQNLDYKYNILSRRLGRSQMSFVLQGAGILPTYATGFFSNELLEEVADKL